MNILYTDFTLQQKSLDIYVAGCYGNPHCEGCHNPESWNFNQGSEYNEKYFSYIRNKVKDFDLLIDNIMIFGGEPLDQDHDELIHMLFDLKSLNKRIWLFTRYELEYISKEIVKLCDYIKTGKYDQNLITNDNIQFGIQLATNNQKIIRVR